MTAATSVNGHRAERLDPLIQAEREIIATACFTAGAFQRLCALGLAESKLETEDARIVFRALQVHFTISQTPLVAEALKMRLGPNARALDPFLAENLQLSMRGETQLWDELCRERERRARLTTLERTAGAIRAGDDELFAKYVGDLNEHVAVARHGKSALKPTVEGPLASLRELAAVATHGRLRLLELAAAPIAFVWADIAPVGTIILIAGAPGEGKTTLLFLLLAARANSSGAPVHLLGREVKPAPHGQFIVLIEGEHGERSTARKLVRSMSLLNVDDSALERIIVVARKAVHIDDPVWLNIVELVKVGLVSDIALDTIARVAPQGSDSNDEGDQVRIFDSVARAIEQAPSNVNPPTCWAAGHTKKGATGDSLEDVSGSTQRVGQVDSVLQVKATRRDGRVVSTRVVFTKLREEPDDYPTPVSFEIKAGQLLTLAAETRHSTPTAEYEKRAAIIEALVRKKPGCSQNYLLNNSGVGTTLLKSTIGGLIEERRIKDDPPPTNGTAHRYYAVAMAGDTDE